MSPGVFVIILLTVVLIMYVTTVGPDWVAKEVAAMLILVLVLSVVFELAKTLGG